MSVMVPLSLLFLFITSASCFLDEADKGDIHAVKQRLEDEKSKRLVLQNDVEMLMLKVALLERQLRGVSPESPTPTEPIYFLARRDAHVTLPKGTTLVFETAVSNSGGGYSPSTGTFRAPATGVYLFSVTITCQHRKLAEVGLKKNQEVLARTLSGEVSDGYYDAGSVTVAVHLEKNDEVYVTGLRATNYITETVTRHSPEFRSTKAGADQELCNV